jgi:hypothetical protein
VNRRGFMGVILATATAPAIIKVDALMRPRKVPFWDTLPLNQWLSAPAELATPHTGLVFPPRPINPFVGGRLFFCIDGEMVEVATVNSLEFTISNPVERELSMVFA